MYYSIPSVYINALVKTCLTCQLKGTAKTKKSFKVFETERPQELFEVDLIDMRDRPDGAFKYIFHMIDHFSHYSWTLPLTSKESREVVNAVRFICYQCGLSPNRIQTDNGLEFVSQEFVDFAIALTGQPPRNTLPRSPQTNGMIEQCHGTLKDRLLSHLVDNPDCKYGWSSYLQHATYSMNFTISRGLINMTPYQAFWNQPLPLQAKLFSARKMGSEQFRVISSIPQFIVCLR